MHDIDKQLAAMLVGDFKTGWEISEKLQKIGPDEILDPSGKKNPEMWLRHNFNRGWFLLQQGKFQEGYKLLDSGRYLSVYGSPPLRTQAPIYNPDEHDTKGKSIIVSLEGGYGDEIIYSRFAASLKKKGFEKVYIACDPNLSSVFSRIEGVDGTIDRNGAHTVAHDYWVPGFSSGWVSGHSFDDLPNDIYLTPKQESVNNWKNVINSKKKKVGIRWAGNPKFEHQQFRRFPVEFITNLSKYEELEIYSLQKDHYTIDLPEGVVDLQHMLISWEDTMAAISLLDIVITSCTSIAHLAAAMGKETWVLTPILPYHTWAYKAPESTTTPFYKSVTLYRQQESKKWNKTFQQLYSDLEKKFDLKHIELPDCDTETKTLNLGCGFNIIPNAVNVDNSDVCKPDIKVDLNQFPWPFKDDEFSHVFAKDVLEHLGETSEDFIKVLKELYRVSNHGAIWEVQVPHWRCDNALNDPTHRRLITLGMFEIFDQSRVYNRLLTGEGISQLAFDHKIDIEVCETQFDYTGPWKEKIKQGLSNEELVFALNTFNNVAESMRLLIQVHKPGRVSQKEIDKLTERVYQS
jgi:hypothetical protein